MIYSETIKYALLALAYLSLNRDRLVKVEEIAEAQRIPKPFISKILHKLAKARVLKSYKGPTGGFTFAAPPKEITIIDVVKHPDEDYKLDYCALRLGRCKDWHGSPCAVHDRWTELREKILEDLTTVTVAELAGVDSKHKQ